MLSSWLNVAEIELSMLARLCLSVVRGALVGDRSALIAGLRLALELGHALDQVFNQVPLGDHDVIEIEHYLFQIRGLDLEPHEALITWLFVHGLV